MMNSMNIYVKTSREVSKNQLDLIYEKIIKGPYVFAWDGMFGHLVLEEPRSQYVNLKLSFEAIISDLMEGITTVIVPRFEKAISDLVKVCSRKGLYHFTQELPRLLNENPLLCDRLLTFTDEVSEDVLDTIKNYLELNMSVNLVAKTMYTHRNTINYRISRFIELTGIDIRSTTNGYYVYMLITWKNDLDCNKIIFE